MSRGLSLGHGSIRQSSGLTPAWLDRRSRGLTRAGSIWRQHVVPEAELVDDRARARPERGGLVRPERARGAVVGAPGPRCALRVRGRRLRGRDGLLQLGINVTVLGPGEPMAMYHRENDQEDFLVLAGEALAIVEGEERPLRQWDFVHCPAGTNHVLVGAGAGPCVVLPSARATARPAPTGAPTRSTRRRSATAPASSRRRPRRPRRMPASPRAGSPAIARAGCPD